MIQPYEADAHNVYAIRGNSVVVKCEVPSFVADFVSVIGWLDSEGNNNGATSDYGNNIPNYVRLQPDWNPSSCIIPSS